jgi:DNA-binding NarL/FixJ family response regulator
VIDAGVDRVPVPGPDAWPERTRLLLVDEPIAAAGLRSLLDEAPDLEVIGTSRDLQLALAVLREQPVDVTVFDASRPGLDVSLALRTVHASNPTMKMIALVEERDQPRLRQLESAPISGHLLKRRAGVELIPAIRHARAEPTRSGSASVDTNVEGEAG